MLKPACHPFSHPFSFSLSVLFITVPSTTWVGADGRTGGRAGGSRAGERARRVGAVHDEQVASMTQ
eukprot:1079301-Prymnesium_polylepis.1